MAKIQGPLLSMGGAGQIGQSQVYSSWKGRPYARRYVIPANPQSTEQMKTRDVFSWLNDVWRIAPADFQAPWTAFAQGKVLTNRNAWLSKNTGVLRPGTDLTGLIMSPGAKGGLSVTPTIVGASAQVIVSASTPAPLPTGWTITQLVAAVIKQQDPHDGTDFKITTGTDVSDPYSVTITSLAAGAYMAAGWFVFQRSGSSTDLAYGPATAAPVTVT